MPDSIRLLMHFTLFIWLQLIVKIWKEVFESDTEITYEKNFSVSSTNEQVALTQVNNTEMRINKVLRKEYHLRYRKSMFQNIRRKQLQTRIKPEDVSQRLKEIIGGPEVRPSSTHRRSESREMRPHIRGRSKRRQDSESSEVDEGEKADLVTPLPVIPRTKRMGSVHLTPSAPEQRMHSFASLDMSPVKRSLSYPCDPVVRQRIRGRLLAKQVMDWKQISQKSDRKLNPAQAVIDTIKQEESKKKRLRLRLVSINSEDVVCLRRNAPNGLGQSHKADEQPNPEPRTAHKKGKKHRTAKSHGKPMLAAVEESRSETEPAARERPLSCDNRLISMGASDTRSLADSGGKRSANLCTSNCCEGERADQIFCQRQLSGNVRTARPPEPYAINKGSLLPCRKLQPRTTVSGGMEKINGKLSSTRKIGIVNVKDRVLETENLKEMVKGTSKTIDIASDSPKQSETDNKVEEGSNLTPISNGHSDLSNDARAKDSPGPTSTNIGDLLTNGHCPRLDMEKDKVVTNGGEDNLGSSLTGDHRNLEDGSSRSSPPGRLKLLQIKIGTAKLAGGDESGGKKSCQNISIIMSGGEDQHHHHNNGKPGYCQDPNNNICSPDEWRKPAKRKGGNPLFSFRKNSLSDESRFSSSSPDD